MDMSRPLWEFHVLNVKTSSAKSVGIGKLHHSLGDGMSLMSLLLASSRKVSDPKAPPTTTATKKHADSSAKGWWCIRRFWLVINIIFTTLIELFKFWLTLCFMRDTKTPLMSEPGDTVRPRKCINRIISLDDVKMIKNTMEMKVNDVLLGMTQAGVCYYRNISSFLVSILYVLKVDDDMATGKKKVRLRGTVAVNLRPDTKIEDLTNMMEKGSKCRWGNFVGIVIFPLWVRGEDDPLEYVRKAKSTMDMKRISMEALILYGLVKCIMKIFGDKAAENIVKRVFGHTTLTFSSVMGPKEEVSLFDHPMSYVTATASGGPQALIIHFVSYVDKIIINLAVDTTVIPDPHQLCDDLVESLGIIKLAALEKGVHNMEVMDDKKNGEAVWVPVNVRVEDHVFVPDIDHSDITNPDQFIEDYTSNIANTLMDMSRPLWEFHVLNIKTSNAESLGIGKFHHSLGDGMSLMSLLYASSRKISDPNALPTTATTRKQVGSNDNWWLVARFWLMIRVIFTTFIELFKSLLTLCFMRDTKTPLMGKPGDRNGPRKIIHRIVSFDDVKFVKKTMKMKVNDVLLGITQAGDDPVTEKKKSLEETRLRGTIAVNLRPETKIKDLADMMTKGSKCRWGNFIGVVIFPLWIRSEDDPLEYVRRAKATMDKKKISMEALVLYGFIKFTMKIFGVKAVEAITKRVFSHTTLTFSNVLGPNEDISFFEHPMCYVGASALIGPQALIIHYVSYADKIIINLAVDTTVIPDPHVLCDNLVESLEIIKLSLLEKGLHKMEELFKGLCTIAVQELHHEVKPGVWRCLWLWPICSFRDLDASVTLIFIKFRGLRIARHPQFVA
ncbi:hypothetical protein IGI04_010613 [Brassica rapa subsp. trilocularis]|nr:hypothetical protein IGI04_010613 [Brassica rapa subsp. trilocularis]